MQEAIRDASAQDFMNFPLHGYRHVPSPRDPAYLSNIVESTNILRVANIDWVSGPRGLECIWSRVKERWGEGEKKGKGRWEVQRMS